MRSRAAQARQEAMRREVLRQLQLPWIARRACGTARDKAEEEPMTDTLKAISLWQPWGSLWLSPNKRHETRHWSTRHRGHLLVHAAKRFERDIDGVLGGLLEDEFGRNWDTTLPTGAIVGMVDLIRVIPTDQLYDAGTLYEGDLKDIECGDFSEGRFGWRRGAYWRFPQPIPYRGAQGLFNVPREAVAAQIAAAVEVSDA
jgi:hypothetical protein